MATNPPKTETDSNTKALEVTSVKSESETPAPSEAEAKAQAKAKSDADIEAKAKVDAEGEANDRLERQYRKTKYTQIFFWGVVIVVTGGILFTASSGALVRPDVWQSLIWFVPLLVLAAPIVYAWVRFALVAEILARLLMSLIVIVIMYIVFFLEIMIGYADDVWAHVAGNETMGQLGLIGTLSVLGLVIVLVLTLVLPLFFFGWLFKSLIQQDINILKVLILAIIAPLSFFFSIGLSIVNNSGF
jgi:hypothetical protein